MPVSAEVVARELKRMTLQKAASELLRYTDKTVRETLEILAEPPHHLSMSSRNIQRRTSTRQMKELMEEFKRQHNS